MTNAPHFIEIFQTGCKARGTLGILSASASNFLFIHSADVTGLGLLQKVSQLGFNPRDRFGS